MSVFYSINKYITPPVWISRGAWKKSMTKITKINDLAAITGFDHQVMGGAAFAHFFHQIIIPVSSFRHNRDPFAFGANPSGSDPVRLMTNQRAIPLGNASDWDLKSGGGCVIVKILKG